MPSDKAKQAQKDLNQHQAWLNQVDIYGNASHLLEASLRLSKLRQAIATLRADPDSDNNYLLDMKVGGIENIVHFRFFKQINALETEQKKVSAKLLPIERYANTDAYTHQLFDQHANRLEARQQLQAQIDQARKLVDELAVNVAELNELSTQYSNYNEEGFAFVALRQDALTTLHKKGADKLRDTRAMLQDYQNQANKWDQEARRDVEKQHNALVDQGEEVESALQQLQTDVDDYLYRPHQAKTTQYCKKTLAAVGARLARMMRSCRLLQEQVSKELVYCGNQAHYQNCVNQLSEQVRRLQQCYSDLKKRVDSPQKYVAKAFHQRVKQSFQLDSDTVAGPKGYTAVNKPGKKHANSPSLYDFYDQDGRVPVRYYKIDDKDGSVRLRYHGYGEDLIVTPAKHMGSTHCADVDFKINDSKGSSTIPFEQKLALTVRHLVASIDPEGINPKTGKIDDANNKPGMRPKITISRIPNWVKNHKNKEGKALGVAQAGELVKKELAKIGYTQYAITELDQMKRPKPKPGNPKPESEDDQDEAVSNGNDALAGHRPNFTGQAANLQHHALTGQIQRPNRRVRSRRTQQPTHSVPVVPINHP